MRLDSTFYYCFSLCKAELDKASAIEKLMTQSKIKPSFSIAKKISYHLAYQALADSFNQSACELL